MLYRAIDRSDYKAGKVYYPYPTKRLPSNVPYVVDNLWEWAKPSEYPSRRHAAYASPCPKQASESSVANDPVVCTLEWHGERKVAQHRVVADAKEHRDVRQLPKLLLNILGREWPSLPLEDKGTEGLLWVPGLGASEVQQILESGVFQNHIEELKAAINFWDEAELISNSSPDSSSSGELFFEYNGGYSLNILT
ncbi:hypothetical protein [Neptuniibacter sp. QD48_11]|uniref:hypothetical protein n=1 Tax=Neptuniibacter sp. QD48_11 TaxID=3398211 RepID=UPI0039F50E76